LRRSLLKSNVFFPCLMAIYFCSSTYTGLVLISYWTSFFKKKLKFRSRLTSPPCKRYLNTILFLSRTCAGREIDLRPLRCRQADICHLGIFLFWTFSTPKSLASTPIFYPWMENDLALKICRPFTRIYLLAEHCWHSCLSGKLFTTPQLDLRSLRNRPCTVS